MGCDKHPHNTSGVNGCKHRDCKAARRAQIKKDSVEPQEKKNY